MRHLYVHVPFCARRCSYCDFAIAVRPDVPVGRFVDAIRRELEQTTPAITSGPADLETFYLGGGTPSSLGIDGIQALMEWVRNHVGLAASAEVTMEVNPDDVTEERVAAWMNAGVTRFSVGVQSFHAATLEWMHRTHDPDVARQAMEYLRAAKAGVSADVIFGLPSQLHANPVDDVRELATFAPDHISAYGLTVEDGTALGKWVQRGDARMPPSSAYARDFLAIRDLLTARGYDHYEVSNYARSGCHSRHNRAYWDRAPYLGLGPSAHSFDGARRWWNVRHWADYIDRVEAGEPVVEAKEELTEGQRRLEDTYLALRTNRGVADDRGEWSSVALARGWLERSGNRLVATAEGWLRLDELVVGLTT